MASKNYKVGEAVEVVYQALNAKTAATINMEVYDEAHVLVPGGPIVLTELGASGRYYGAFTPDNVGEWQVQIEESNGDGKVVKAFSVGTKHLQDVGATVDSIANDTTTLGTNLGIVEGKVDTIDSAVAVLDGEVSALDSAIVVLDAKVDGLASPPMVG